MEFQVPWRFSFMAYFVRVARSEYSTGQLIFARALAGVLIFGYLCRRDLKKLVTAVALPLWGRAVFGGLSVACFFFNLRDCSLGTAIVMTNLSPVFVSVLSVVFALEAFRSVALAGVIMASIGVALLVSPSSASLSIESLSIGIFGALMGAFAYMSLKQATTKYSFPMIVFAFSVALFFVSMVDRTPLLPVKSHASFALLAAIVVLSLIAQVTLTMSYRLLPSTAAATLSLTEVFWSALLDAVLFGANAPPVAYVAMVMIVAGARMTFIRGVKSNGVYSSIFGRIPTVAGRFRTWIHKP